MTPIRRRSMIEMGWNDELYRHLHPAPRAGHRRQSDDPGARPAGDRLAADPAISTHRERGGHRDDDLLRRRPGRDRRFITTPLENAIAQANGIDYMSSTSLSSVSTITVYLRLNYDADKALTEIGTKVRSVLEPACRRLAATGRSPSRSGRPSMRCIWASTAMCCRANKITDYLTRVVQPKLQAVPGVQTAEILGGQNFALRAWLDPAKLAAYGLTATDVSAALAQNDYISGLGTTKGQMVQVNLTARPACIRWRNSPISIVKQANGAHRPAQGCRPCYARRRRPTRSEVGLRWQAGGLYRHPGGADRQPARRDRGRAQGLPGDPGRNCRTDCMARSSTIRPIS